MIFCGRNCSYEGLSVCFNVCLCVRTCVCVGLCTRGMHCFCEAVGKMVSLLRVGDPHLAEVGSR